MNLSSSDKHNYDMYDSIVRIYELSRLSCGLTIPNSCSKYLLTEFISFHIYAFAVFQAEKSPASGGGGSSSSSSGGGGGGGLMAEMQKKLARRRQAADSDVSVCLFSYETKKLIVNMMQYYALAIVICTSLVSCAPFHLIAL